MTIMDAVCGIFLYGEASVARVRKGTDYDTVVRELAQIKDTVQNELRALRDDPNDGSYENFDVAVRSELKLFAATLERNHPVVTWVNECLDVHFTPGVSNGENHEDNLLTSSVVKATQEQSNVIAVDFRRK